MSKENITNRKAQKIILLVENADKQKGLAFIAHGLGGFKEEPHIATIGESFKEKGITVVRFDTTNTFGESDGAYEDATVTNYYEDLEDVISWSREQSWYRQPFYLAGHSLGGLSTLLYAENHPADIKGVASLSAIISGKMSAEVLGEEYIAEWEKAGIIEEENASLPGVMKRLQWNHMIDRLQYDVLPRSDQLTMPILLIVGDRDRLVPVEHQQIFYQQLPGDRELHIIENALHTPRDSSHLSEIKEIFSRWIDKMERG